MSISVWFIASVTTLLELAKLAALGNPRER